VNLIFSLRALAALKSPQMLGQRRREAASIAAIRSWCSEIVEGNSRVADRTDLRASDLNWPSGPHRTFVGGAANGGTASLRRLIDPNECR